MAKNSLQDILGKLGLTEYESKTLNTLFMLKEAKAPEISQESQVPKTRVYDVLDSLVGKKLIVEIKGRPKRYRLVEPKETLKKLLETRRGEINLLEQEIETIAEETLIGREAGFEEEKVLKVKEKDDFLKILSQEILDAKNNIFAFSDLTEGHAIISKALKTAKDKNVSVQILHSSPVIELEKYKEHELESKNFPHKMNAFIIDNKKLVLALSDLNKEKPEYYFTIWHHKPLANVLQNHFQECWKKAK